MGLTEWMKENGRTQGWVAKKIGVTAMRMSRICRGILEPTLQEISDIYDLTHRKVTWRDFLPQKKGKK